MTTKAIKPLAAFAVNKGKVTALDDAWPDIEPHSGYRWLHFDLKDPSTEAWAKEHLPDVAAMALLQSETRPRCERLGDGLILNLRAVNLNPESDPEDMVSLRMWVTESSIISARPRKVFAVDAIRRSAEDGTAPNSVGQFIVELLHVITNRIEEVSLMLEESTDHLEEEMSEGSTIPTERIVAIRRAVIKMRRFVNPQREAIAALAGMDNWVLEPEKCILLRETSNRTRRSIEELDAVRDRLTALQDHVYAVHNHALSRNSYILSVVAAIFLPLGFLTGLFGVNLGGMPGVASVSAFWILTGISVISGVALFLIFKFSNVTEQVRVASADYLHPTILKRRYLFPQAEEFNHFPKKAPLQRVLVRQVIPGFPLSLEISIPS